MDNNMLIHYCPRIQCVLQVGIVDCTLYCVCYWCSKFYDGVDNGRIQWIHYMYM